MSTSPVEPRPSARTVKVSDDEPAVHLADGRTIAVPTVWFPRDLQATAAARRNWDLLGGGEGIHWPGADGDLSVEKLLGGGQARGAA